MITVSGERFGRSNRPIGVQGAMAAGAAIVGPIIAFFGCAAPATGSANADGATQQCSKTTADPQTLFESCVTPGSSQCIDRYFDQLQQRSCAPVAVHEIEGERICVLVGEYRCSLDDGNVFHAFVSFEWGQSPEGAAVQVTFWDVEVLGPASSQVCRGTKSNKITSSHVPPGCARQVRGDGSYAAEVRARLEDPAAGRPVISAFDFDVVDAAYSRAHERLLIASESPRPALYLLDPAAAGASEVALSSTPRRVVVDPSGRWALVAHDGQLTLVDLATAQVSRTVAIDFSARELVLASDAVAYAVPAEREALDIRGINLDTGIQTRARATGLHNAVGRLVLHPDGTKLYGVTTGVSPVDLERYAASATAVTYAYDSPFHGGHNLYGPLLLSADGQTIFAGTATFTAADVKTADMVHQGDFADAQTGFRQADLHPDGTKLAAIPASLELSEVWLYTVVSREREKSLTLPGFVADRRYYPGRGQFAFFDSTGEVLYVVVAADRRSSTFGLAALR